MKQDALVYGGGRPDESDPEDWRKRGDQAVLESLGFVAGGYVTVVSQINGNLIVNVKESRVAISKEMANRIMV